jgi:hypothetical protein
MKHRASRGDTARDGQRYDDPGMSLQASPRVFDCFPFNDELLLLRFRLELLDPVVDRFVLVEADTNHQGRPKELFFSENRDMFAPWLAKISHVVVRDMPSGADSWARENFQRRAILRGLQDADPTDIVIISDADEIPDPRTVQRLVAEPPAEPVALDMDLSYYCVDLRVAGPWKGNSAKACLMRDLGDIQSLRDARDLRASPDSGWHLSWLSAPNEPGRKLRSIVETEHFPPWFASPRHARRCLDLGADLLGRFVLQPVPWDELDGPLRELASAHPELVHGPRSGWRTFLAHCYLTTAWGARFLPLWLTDAHPVATFAVAAPLRVAAFLFLAPVHISAFFLRKARGAFRRIARRSA